MKKLITTSLSLALTATALSPFSAAASSPDTASEARPSFETQKITHTGDFMSLHAFVGDKTSNLVKKNPYAIDEASVTEENPYLTWEVVNTHSSDYLRYMILDGDRNVFKVGFVAPGDTRKFNGVEAPVGQYTLYFHSLGEIDNLQNIPVPSGHAELKSVQVGNPTGVTSLPYNPWAAVTLKKDDSIVASDTVNITDELAYLSSRVSNDASSTLPIFYYVIDQNDNYIASGSVNPGETDRLSPVKVVPGEYKLYLIDQFKNEAEGELITVLP